MKQKKDQTPRESNWSVVSQQEGVLGVLSSYTIVNRHCCGRHICNVADLITWYGLIASNYVLFHRLRRFSKISQRVKNAGWEVTITYG